MYLAATGLVSCGDLIVVKQVKGGLTLQQCAGLRTHKLTRPHRRVVNVSPGCALFFSVS